MVYNDTSTKQGILQEIESLVFSSDYGKITSDTTRLQTFTRYCNQALDKVTTKVLQSDNTWEFDDSSATDLPIGVTDLLPNQQDYSLAVTHLKILGVSIKDQSGLWIKLEQISPDDMGNQDRSEFMKIAGSPIFYDVIGNSVFLYPKPASANVTLSGGLKVYFQRQLAYFTTSDTTKIAGFPAIFHRLIVLWASYFYCQAGSISKISQIAQEIQVLEREMEQYYSKRNKERKPRLTMARVHSN